MALTDRIFTRIRYRFGAPDDAFSLTPEVLTELHRRWRLANKEGSKEDIMMDVGYWQLNTYTERSIRLSDILWIEPTPEQVAKLAQGE